MTTERKTSVKERVAAGAAWLDKVDPTWIDRIDLSTLDLNDACGCVLGQIVKAKTKNDDVTYYDCVAGDTYSSESVEVVKAEMPRGGKGLVMSHATAVARGFHTDRISASFSPLTREWKTLIKARRASV